MSSTPITVFPTSLPSTNASSPDQTGVFKGRTFHWSTFVLGGAAVVGVIVAIAAYIFSNNLLIVVGVFFTASSLVGAYYTHTFSKYKSLQTYVLTLQDQIAQLKNVSVQTNETISKIDELTKELDGLRKKRKKEATSFAEEIKTNAEELDDLRKKLQKNETEFKAKLEESEGKLRKTSEKLSEVQKIKFNHKRSPS